MTYLYLNFKPYFDISGAFGFIMNIPQTGSYSINQYAQFAYLINNMTKT